MSFLYSNYDWDNKDDLKLNVLNNNYLNSLENPNKSEKSISNSKTDLKRLESKSIFLENFHSENVIEKSKTLDNVNESSISSKFNKKDDNYLWLGLNKEEDHLDVNFNSSSKLDLNLDENWISKGLTNREKKNLKKDEIKKEPLSKINLSENNLIETKFSNDKNLKDVEFSNQLKIFQTKIIILEDEKKYLSEFIENLNKNHEKEIILLKNLHEQQLSLTKSLLNEQEIGIKDKKDRNINELKLQLDLAERSLEENRLKSNEKIDKIEKDWCNEIHRIKNIHNISINRLIEQHEQDLNRMKHLKEREIEALQNFQNKFISLDNLLIKWEHSTEQIEEMHKKLKLENNELINEKLTNLDFKDQKITDIESKWYELTNNLKSERESSQKLKNVLIQAIEDQKNLIEKEREQFKKDQKNFEMERKNFLNEKKSWEMDLEKERNFLKEELINQRKSADILSVKLIDLDEQRKIFLKSETDWNLSYEKQRQYLINLTSDLNSQKIKLLNDENDLKKNQEKFFIDQKSLNEKKSIFDKEKNELKELSLIVSKKSEELEKINISLSLDKKENEKFIKDAEKFKIELDEKLKYLELNLKNLNKKELTIEKQSELIRNEWKQIQIMKQKVLCSLCDKCWSIQNNDFLNINKFLNKHVENSENDKKLLAWHLTGQEDAALLEEETAFLKVIQKK